MNRIKMVLFAVSLVCFTSAAFADATFENSGGSLKSLNGGTGYYLQSSGSQLSGVNGLGALDCSGLASQGGTCSGLVSFTTGLTSGLAPTLIDNVGGPATVLTGPGSIKISEGGSTIFTGTFVNALWTYVGTCTGISSCGVTGGYYEWQLSGNITGTYSNGQPANGALVQLTTQPMKNDPFIHGTGTIGIAGGSSTLQTVPESGTLVLFGTGLVAVALLTRRKALSVRS